MLQLYLNLIQIFSRNSLISKNCPDFVQKLTLSKLYPNFILVKSGYNWHKIWIEWNFWLFLTIFGWFRIDGPLLTTLATNRKVLLHFMHTAFIHAISICPDLRDGPKERTFVWISQRFLFFSLSHKCPAFFFSIPN